VVVWCFPSAVLDLLVFVLLPSPPHHSTSSWGQDTRLIYRHYATLYFVFVVDQQESELGILDLVQGTACG